MPFGYTTTTSKSIDQSVECCGHYGGAEGQGFGVLGVLDFQAILACRKLRALRKMFAISSNTIADLFISCRRECSSIILLLKTCPRLAIVWVSRTRANANQTSCKVYSKPNLVPQL